MCMLFLPNGVFFFCNGNEYGYEWYLEMENMNWIETIAIDEVR